MLVPLAIINHFKPTRLLKKTITINELYPEGIHERDLAVAPDPERITWLTQTTLANDETEEITAAVLARFPAARRPPSDDICYATTNRQDAVRQVAAECDLVLVVGSANSSNSVRLVEVAERAGARARLVEDASRVRPEWLAGARRIGITAGASAPPHLVDTLVAGLRGLGSVVTTTRGGGPETVSFGLPKEVFDL